MNRLRKIIRSIILEDKQAFEEEILSDPSWDEGENDHDLLSQNNRERIYRDARTRGRLVKQKWAKHVDREWVQSLTYIHWSDLDNTLNLIKNSYGKGPSKNELACKGYLPGYVDTTEFEASRFGVIVKGHVSLFANNMDDVYSGEMTFIKSANPEMANTSGVNRGAMVAKAATYILGVHDFEAAYDPEENQTEAFLDNWKITGVVFKYSDDEWDQEYQEELMQSLQELGIDIPIHETEDL